jgi:signal transduction histidine kinase
MDNLISNAIKHTVKDQGVIEVAVSYDEDTKELKVSIRDNGEGIPREYLDKVFDKFVQVESRQLGTKLDTGLGLTFCELAVGAHGGKIWVTSPSTSLGTGEEGQGSEFFFTLPQS